MWKECESSHAPIRAAEQLIVKALWVLQIAKICEGQVQMSILKNGEPKGPGTVWEEAA